MKNIKALRKGFFVVLLLAGIATNAFCIEPSPAQRVSPTSITSIVNCPVEARFIGYNTPTGWQSNIITMYICYAELVTAPSPNNQDALFCRYGSSTCLSNSIMGSLMKYAPKGSCTINPDKKSFTCVNKLQ